MKRQSVLWAVAVFCAMVWAVGCTTAPKSEEGKEDIQGSAAKAVASAEKADPGFVKLLNSAAGYAVFPKITKAAVGVGGAYGKGVLFENGKAVGYCDMTQATVGAQLGGQGYTEIIAFETPKAVETFKKGNFRFAAQVSAVALKSGASENAKYTEGVAVFTLDETGLMAEAAIGGQKFDYQAK